MKIDDQQWRIFFHDYWQRPAACLQPAIRRATSVWATVGPAAEQRAIGG